MMIVGSLHHFQYGTALWCHYNMYESRRLTNREWRYFKRMKEIQYRHTRPYLPHGFDPKWATEEEIRDRIRIAAKAMPKDEWLAMQAELEELRDEFFDERH